MKEILYYIIIGVGKKNVTQNITHTLTMLKDILEILHQ